MYWEGAYKKSWLIFYLVRWIINRSQMFILLFYILLHLCICFTIKKNPEPDLGGCLCNTTHQSGAWPTIVKKNTGDEFSQIPRSFLLENGYAANPFFFFS